MVNELILDKKNIVRLKTENVSAKQFADLILNISLTLLESGAHCERVNRNVQRMAKSMNYRVDLLLSFTAVSASVVDLSNPQNDATATRQLQSHGVHYGVLTKTSMLTWEFVETEMTISEFESRLQEIKLTPKYSKWLIRFFIGVACACLCLLSSGSVVDALFAGVAAFIGLTIRKILQKRGYNLMLAFVIAAFTTTSIASLDVVFQLGGSPSVAVATAVLYLIPGVPLINCIIDLMEGYIPIGIARGTYGGFILLCIAIGMFLSMTLIGINYY